MRPLRVTIIDLVTKGPTNSLYARVMNQNLASIMPQVVGVWCEELGHQVRFICYTGREDLHQELLEETGHCLYWLFYPISSNGLCH